MACQGTLLTVEWDALGYKEGGERCFLYPHWKKLYPTPIPGVREGMRNGRGTDVKPLLTQTAHPALWVHIKAVCFPLSAAAVSGKISLPASPLPRPL